jgi:beta-galactosidase/beta-glucuronidase
MSVPRPEHPDPQFQRDAWINLNGEWSFAFDPGRSGRERGWPGSHGFDRKIIVPFCPESKLSGVGHTDFIEAMWYHRTIRIPRHWADHRVLLHFGGVDFESEVFVDGRVLGRHFGGASSFALDITDAVQPGSSHHLVVRVHDDTRSGVQPGGKQCTDLHSRGCHYTRTTGIWQTVWLEAVAHASLRDVTITPDLAGERFFITPHLRRCLAGLSWRIGADDGSSVAGPLVEGVPLALQLDDPRPWSPDDPHLYDLSIEVLDGETVVDRVSSYAGLRSFEVDGTRLLLNGQPIFLRLVLDQGFYPEGIWTAPSDEALRRDIELAMAAGFHGARLHQKAFEPRFHYWADRMGYLTWGESPSWGVKLDSAEGMRNFTAEWTRLVERDRNHPSIIAWTPFNETWFARHGGDGPGYLRTLDEIYALTRTIDPTRPVVTASGGDFASQDIVAMHCYEQDPHALAPRLDDLQIQVGNTNVEAAVDAAADRPLVLDEYGGTRWNPNDPADRTASWGYGANPATIDQFYQRIGALTDAIVDRPRWSGYCYTQLTDVEQEQNGIYFYDRSAKFDADRIRAIFSRRPDWSRW